MSDILASGLPLVLLAAGAFGWMRRSRFSAAIAAALAALAMVQAGVVVCLVEPGQTLWLALGLGALGVSASALAEHESLRRIMAFTGSLAAIQLCDPLGGVVAAGMLPAAFAIGPRRSAHKAAGLFPLLLFVPVITAALLAWFGRPELFTYVPGGLPHAPSTMTVRLAVTLCPMAVAAPVLFCVRRTRAGRAVFLVGTAALLASLNALWNGASRDTAETLSLAAPLCLAGVAAIPHAARREQLALLTVAAGAVLSWTAYGLASV